MTTSAAMTVRKGASTSLDPRVAARELFDAIHQPDAALTVFYCSPIYDLDALGGAIHELFGDDAVIGCTTAGEITPLGYLDGALTGVSFGGPSFHVSTVRIDRIADFELARGNQAADEALLGLKRQGSPPPTGQDCFGFLLVDGLSMQEEGLVSALYHRLGSIQLFGGSAGDGTRFEKTFLYHEGRFRTDVAVFSLVQSSVPFVVFKTEHFVASNEKLVITGADPARRIVTEINGEPAGREYAHLVGMEVDKLTPLIFASHPVMVTIGDTVFVRSIQKVNDDESLTFFCAIDEGIVLTVAQPVSMVDNLRRTFAKLQQTLGEIPLILGCDCILRFLETGQAGIREEIGAIMQANNVVGFATYGEQFNAMHVNQTFTGVALGGASRHVAR